jgi:hypothetical protein
VYREITKPKKKKLIIKDKKKDKKKELIIKEKDDRTKYY